MTRIPTRSEIRGYASWRWRCRPLHRVRRPEEHAQAQWTLAWRALSLRALSGTEQLRAHREAARRRARSRALSDLVQGPRQDAGGASAANVGVRTAATAYTFAQREGDGDAGTTRVVVVGVRTPAEALQVSGVDYMVLPDSVQQQLRSTATLQGYNDGLSAAARDSDGAGVPALSRAAVEAYEFSDREVAELTADTFQDEMGMAGQALLREQLARDSEAASRVSSMICSVVVARE